MHIVSITLAVNNMEATVGFYSEVFNASIARMGDTPFYSGIVAGLPMLFCPNDIAEVDAHQSRHQMRYMVDNLDAALHAVMKHGGHVRDMPHDESGSVIAGVVDPDGNTLELVQRI